MPPLLHEVARLVGGRPEAEAGRVELRRRGWTGPNRITTSPESASGPTPGVVSSGKEYPTGCSNVGRVMLHREVSTTAVRSVRADHASATFAIEAPWKTNPSDAPQSLFCCFVTPRASVHRQNEGSCTAAFPFSLVLCMASSWSVSSSNHLLAVFKTVLRLFWPCSQSPNYSAVAREGVGLQVGCATYRRTPGEDDRDVPYSSMTVAARGSPRLGRFRSFTDSAGEN